jgi:hypothetical protein
LPPCAPPFAEIIIVVIVPIILEVTLIYILCSFKNNMLLKLLFDQNLIMISHKFVSLLSLPMALLAVRIKIDEVDKYLPLLTFVV